MAAIQGGFITSFEDISPMQLDKCLKKFRLKGSTLTGRTGHTEICRSILTSRFIALLIFNYVGNLGKE